MNIEDYELEIKNILNKELKDFQRATVDHVSGLFWNKKNSKKRILVSDEVGLGKTLIAKGIIAKLADKKIKEIKIKGKNLNDDKIKIVYICSNAAIASQNIRKLQIMKGKTEVNNLRLSMQHLKIQQETEKNNFISMLTLTPATSFNGGSSCGTYEERALMCFHIVNFNDLTKSKEQKIKRLFKYKSSSFEREYLSKKEVISNLSNSEEYVTSIRNSLNTRIKKVKIDNMPIIDYILNVCEEDEEILNKKVVRIIRELRLLFSDISLEKLKPDLVIMDEFQRYKYLIKSPESEDNKDYKLSDLEMLTNKFFDIRGDQKVLLLSATPYKMYSTVNETIEYKLDEHYEEYVSIMDFLHKGLEGKNKLSVFTNSWTNYHNSLHDKNMPLNQILKYKEDYQKKLLEVMCRTERKIDKNIIKTYNKIELLPEDIKSYMAISEFVYNTIEKGVSVDYAKSCPYLLSFMNKYKLKSELEEKKKIKNELLDNKYLFIDEQRIDGYREIKPNNSRLKYIKDIIFDRKDELEKLLWIPPTLPYYKLKGVYAGKTSKNISKYLIFSAWEMVPRMLSTLLSYESEYLLKVRPRIDYDKDEYNQKEDKKSGSYNFAIRFETNPKSIELTYPSITLKNVYKPTFNKDNQEDLKDIMLRIKNIIYEKLLQIKDKLSLVGNKYYLIPLLLDEEEYVNNWLYKLNNICKNEESYNTIRNELNRINNSSNTIKKISKEKLNEYAVKLTKMAIGSPAVCMARTYDMYPNGYDSIYSTIIAEQIVRIFDNNIGSAVIKSSSSKKSRRSNINITTDEILEYSVNGCLQAVIDEYVHLLGTSDAEVIKDLIVESVRLRQTPYQIDTKESFIKRIKGDNSIPKKNMRTHFAVAFANGDNDDSGVNRTKNIRDAFNSPFRPFVVASTSIGQEGLDFHNYCRKIVHWNLPSNPIDIEQREGRIYRYKCLAIRQNIKYNSVLNNKEYSFNIWKQIFDELEENNKSSLKTFWGIDESITTPVTIDRIIPCYPHSKDIKDYNRQLNILNSYRITMGHPKQEELLENLYNRFNEEERNMLYINISPYYQAEEKKSIK